MSEGNFKVTRWTTVLRAGQPETEGASTALGQLCEDYRPPLYEFARVWLKTPEDAEDLTQSFFYHFIQRNLPAAASHDRGRFRTFLLACFKNFMRDDWRRGKRQRNIPEKLLTSLNVEPHTEHGPGHQPAVAACVDEQLDRLWARSVRQRIVQSLQSDYTKRGKAALFGHLGCLLRGRKPDKSYAEIAAELSMSEAAIKMEVMRLREKFRDRFREEIAQTVTRADEVEAECRYLLEVLFSGEDEA
jgi:RNA polymerase sigma factor (sigma-70 family)